MEKEYTIKLTKRQLQLLSYACDRMSRLIEGQDWIYQELMEQAWEKRCKEVVGGHGMDNEWDGGWYKMREDAEDISKKIKKRFWGCEPNQMYGIKYDSVSDTLYDMHQVMRHQLWLDSDRQFIGVDSSEAMQVSDEPLIKIE
jgi:hypothetical protein